MAGPNRQAPDIPTQVRGTEDGAEPDPARFRWELARDDWDLELRGIDHKEREYINSLTV